MSVRAALDHAAHTYASLRDECDNNNDNGTGNRWERDRKRARAAGAAFDKLLRATKAILDRQDTPNSEERIALVHAYEAARGP